MRSSRRAPTTSQGSPGSVPLKVLESPIEFSLLGPGQSDVCSLGRDVVADALVRLAPGAVLAIPPCRLVDCFIAKHVSVFVGE